MKKLFLLGLLTAFLLSAHLNAQTKTQLVSVHGNQMRAKTSGLAERKAYQPIVILEAGSGQSLESWDAVFEQIAEFSPVLSYERAGLGESLESGKKPTIEARAEELEVLLEEMNIQPPYILAGNNWGNLIIREFAEDHPTEVEGMVYVDPLADSDNPAQFKAHLNNQGLDGEKLVSQYLNYQTSKLTAGLTEGKKQENEMFLNLLTENQLNWSAHAVPEVASIVILGRSSNVYPVLPPFSMDSREFLKLQIAGKVDYFEKYTLEHPEYSLNLTSGSMNLPFSQPTAVAQSVRQVLYSDPNKKIMNAAHRLSPEEFDVFITDLYSYIPASLLTEENINMMGYNLMRFDKYKQALSLFKKNLENHPNSANVYDSMGDGLMALGRVEEAVPLFKKAVELGAEPQHRDFELFKKNLIKGEAMLAGKDK